MTNDIPINFDLSALTGTDLKFAIKSIIQMRAHAIKHGHPIAGEFYFQILVLLIEIATRESGPVLDWLQSTLAAQERRTIN